MAKGIAAKLIAERQKRLHQSQNSKVGQSPNQGSKTRRPPGRRNHSETGYWA